MDARRGELPPEKQINSNEQVANTTNSSKKRKHDFATYDVDLCDLTCPITQELFFEPVALSPCGHLVEGKLAASLRSCPMCRNGGDSVSIIAASPAIKNMLATVLVSHPELYEKVYFNLDYLTEIVRKNELNTPTGERFITLLQNVAPQLNDKATLEILASKRQGRELLRRNEKLRHLLSEESLQIIISGKTVKDWLSMEQEEPEAAPVSSLGIFASTNNSISGISIGSANATTRHSTSSASNLNHFQRVLLALPGIVCQNVVYGFDTSARDMILARQDLLTQKATVTDYAGRTIDEATPFQAALRTGDIDMCEMIKGRCIEYLYNGQAILNAQFAEVFPNGLESHLQERRRATYNFDAIVRAITDAQQADVAAALAKQDNGSALCMALTDFRTTFRALSLREKVFNPLHLLSAIDIYYSKFDTWGPAPYWDKLDLFWRQVIGYIQRYLPACYAQAYCTNISEIVRNNHPLIRKVDLHNLVTQPESRISFFPLDMDQQNRLGLDFAVGGLFWADATARSFRSTNYFQLYVDSQTSRLATLCVENPSYYARLRRR